MSKLSILLLTLAGGCLTGCNSGASGASTPNSTNLAHNESSVKSTQDTSLGYNIGLVITKDGNLDFYKDDKFISTVWKFEDQPTSVRIASVGDLDTNKPFVAYVTTKTEGIAGYSGDGGLLKRCAAAPLSGNGMECVTIDSFEDPVYAANLDKKGDGYAISIGESSTISRYVNNRLVAFTQIPRKLLSKKNLGNIKTYVAYSNGLEVYNGNLFFVDGRHSRILYNIFGKQDIYYVAELGENLFSFSVDKDLNGYGIGKYSLYHILAGRKLDVVHTFEDIPLNLSSTGSWIYVVTAGKELKRCGTGGDCSTIDTFGSTPLGVSFRAL